MGKGNAGGGLRRFYLIFAIIAVVGVAAIGWSIGSNAIARAATEPVDLEGTQDLRQLTEMAQPVTMGREDAPVTIIVFEDYLCSHCAMFSLRERPQIQSAFIDTGKARLVYYDFVLDPRSEVGAFLAARAARCANDQGRFWEYQDQLYRNQITWAGASDKVGIFEDYAESLGLDMDEFKGCLNSDRHAREVSADRELAHELGLGGTPSVLVGSGQGMSRRLGSYSFEVIQEAVESILQGTSGDSSSAGAGG